MSSDSVSRFPSVVYGERLRRVSELVGRAGWDAVLITPGPDLRYVIGARGQTFERLTCLVVPANGAAPTVVVPRMELATLIETAVADLDIDVVDWTDGVDPHALVATSLPRRPTVGVSESTPALHLLPLSETLAGRTVLATPVLRSVRMRKDDAEIDVLRRAGAAIDRVHARMGQWLQVGRSESDVAADIGAAIVEEGHTRCEFVIVGSGPHGADPHHEVSERVLERGDVVVIDIGGPVEPGYHSDSTRTYVLGTPDDEVIVAYSALERAQAAAVDAVRPAITAEDIDAAARTVLEDAGLAEAFVHRTGHGIGLSVHEEPYIVAGNPLQLEVGMAFSVEPGIYFPGRWGARIEDIVVVTEDGVEPLNRRPHGLVEL